jgi:hypothetical protein
LLWFCIAWRYLQNKTTHITTSTEVWIKTCTSHW